MYFERAEEHFSSAISIAPNATWKTAAHAGRAQVKVWLEDWAGAVSDAAQVPDDFHFDLEMDITAGNTNQRNHLYFAAASIPYRSYSVKHTFFEGYYTETGDPRTPWVTYALATDNDCVGSLQGYPGGGGPLPEGVEVQVRERRHAALERP